MLTEIRYASKADVSAIALIHKKQFADHLLGKLSVSLIDKLYSTFFETCILLVSVTNGRVNGFLLGGHMEEIKRIKQFFIRDNRLELFSYVLSHPKSYWSSFLHYKDLIEDGLNSNIPLSEMRLLSIAVEENFKGSGVAERLIQHFEDIIAGHSEYGLSVKKDQRKGNLLLQ